MITNNFIGRHIGPTEKETKEMLKSIGVNSLDELIYDTVPDAIRLPNPINIGTGMNEYEYIQHLKKIGSKNKVFKTFIGMGYYNTITPGVITRNVLENAGWYTAYTPYQAEISQGRLEALLNFQTMVSDLSGMPIANASLLDEATAAAEAMIMFYNARTRNQIKQNIIKFFVSDGIFPQTLDVIRTRAIPLNIEIISGSIDTCEIDDSFFGIILQYPDQFGAVRNNLDLIQKLKSKEIQVAVAADILSLALLVPPGEWGADVVLGSTQRFGVPMGFGGPHAAYFATSEKYKRSIPGRIIGISKDVKGNNALRMALQTREQHIKREKATSNICTAQALLAAMAGFYAVYHGQEGIRQIARHINILSAVLQVEMGKIGVKQLNEFFFDTLQFELNTPLKAKDVCDAAVKHEMNFRFIDNNRFGISLDETTSLDDVNKIVAIVAEVVHSIHQPYICNPKECELLETIPSLLKRQSLYLTHPVFNSYHSETDMMRYLKKLENRDLSLNRTMIPLGSCTMKLNAAAELFSLSWSEFAEIHPFVPREQAEGYMELIQNLEKDLCEITGFEALTFQPNSGASGEYTGLLVIRAYLISKGESHRNICLIPSSAHGTNPASAVMAGMEVLVVKCDEYGNVDLDDLRQKAVANKEKLAAIMVTYPSTHGVFEKGITDLIDIVHSNGGQVYMDGANMNAQVGLTSPGFIGADVCHLNLHKTFAIPHGGGGPGVGPIAVAKHLVEFLPGHSVVNFGSENAVGAVSAAPYGSAMILPISYGYIKLLGGKGLTYATEMAILNANYLKDRLKDHYPILYTGNKGRVAHEMILDCNQFSKTANVAVIDIAKRLMDYGFHAPTVAFPVHGTLMVEPTESEPLAELDRFVDAMIAIRNEIAEIENGKADVENNVISNAPHTLEMLLSSEWDAPYTREKAAFPMHGMLTDKYFTPITRIDDAFGDRNLICTCPPVETYIK
ncbi:MAG: glycine dehydrogenase (aminomethyl-transferring) [Bacteroidetes bacterium HGW-Bacteroidetes-1]|jgi:glycine dehydrogenase|nr:MAG: glycine dehydrogenase (aminomethyl-transferring) [Bacteroidetes bacterium HGW-Bacteroidetes-1]